MAFASLIEAAMGSRIGQKNTRLVAQVRTALQDEF
jgi:hypothetical protein